MPDSLPGCSQSLSEDLAALADNDAKTYFEDDRDRYTAV